MGADLARRDAFVMSVAPETVDSTDRAV